MGPYRVPDERVQIESVAVSNELARVDLSDRARSYAQDSRASNTKRGYLSDTRQFARWCVERRQSAIPATPATVANYVSWLAEQGRRVATIERSLAAISQAHKLGGFSSPRNDEQVREVMKGIRRTIGVAPQKKAPVLVDDLRTLVAATGIGIKATRDRALLTLGFAGAFRRSELVALDVRDLCFTRDGLEVVLKKSKTDQEGVGEKLGIPYGGHPATCPVRSTKAWLDAAGLVEGPVFRPINRHEHVSATRLSGKAVASVLKQLASTVGLDPKKLGAHSLRAGLVTTAIRAGKQERVIMRQTRHKSVAVFRGYIRDADLFRENAAAGIGL